MGAGSVVICGVKVVIAVALVSLTVQNIAQSIRLICVCGFLKAPFGGCRVLTETVGKFPVYCAVIPEWIIEVGKFKSLMVYLVQGRGCLLGYSVGAEAFSRDKYHIVVLEHAGVFVCVGRLHS